MEWEGSDIDRPSDVISELQPCTRQFYEEHKGESYPMSDESRGTAHIFNLENFVDPDDKRDGTDVDLMHLMKAFKKLHFKTAVHDDDKSLTAQGLKDHMIRIASEIDSNDQSVVICILSHGDEKQEGEKKESIIMGKDGKYISVDELLRPLSDQECPNLKGKPRLVLFQACRGEIFAPDPDKDCVDKKIFKDFFIGYAADQGHASIRKWFVHAVVQKLMQSSHNQDIKTILESVKETLPKELKEDRKRNQFPDFDNHLTKKLYFYPGILLPRPPTADDGTSSRSGGASAASDNRGLEKPMERNHEIMTDAHKKILKKNLVKLKTGLKINDMVAKLSEEVLTAQQSFKIRSDKYPTDEEKAEHLLMDILPFKQDWVFVEFVGILKADEATRYLGLLLDP